MSNLSCARRGMTLIDETLSPNRQRFNTRIGSIEQPMG
jgi:hypothetical protein